jgi:pSer/pThr/pTyr-binding forkhead associated (FHA) protein
MQVLLRIANGKSNVRKVRLQADTIIGRSPDCQLKVASNQISRRHCQIFVRQDSVAIKDLGSANGTFVNGRRVPPEVEVPLTPGTRIMLGPLQFTVEYDIPGVVSACPVSQEDGAETLSVG